MNLMFGTSGRRIIPRTYWTRMIFFLLSDTALIVLAVILAFLLRFDGAIPHQYFDGVLQRGIILILILCLPIFYIFKLYSFSWMYISTNELLSLVKAGSISFSIFGAVLFITRDQSIFQGFPRTVLVISYLLIFIFCGGIRFSKRIFLQVFKSESKSNEQARTLIVGAGDAGEQILRNVLGAQQSFYVPIGFIDDDPGKRGETIHGLKVLGSIDEIPSIVKGHGIEEIIIALPSAGSQIIARAVDMSRKADLKKIKIVPSIAEIVNSEVSLGSIRDVQVEDLLGREPVSLDTKSIENFIQGKIILTTGAAGSIGSELCRQVAKFNPALLVLVDQDETGVFNISEELIDRFPRLKIEPFVANIRNGDKIEKIFTRFRPNVVFHAAAYKHVPLMEKHPDEAVLNNIFGTKILGEISNRYDVEKFIFISTDKAVNPSSIMGATKRIGEKICQALNQKNHTKFISVRFGNVLNSRGSVIPTFKEQIKKGGPVEVTHPDMKRYFMVTSEACLLVMQAGTIGSGGEVFVLDMGQPIKILDLAREMIRLSGFEYDKEIPIVFTGTRPGEKLFEEILTAEEGTMATQNRKIFIARMPEINEILLNDGLSRLKEIINRSCDRAEITNILKILVPSYLQNQDDITL